MKRGALVCSQDKFITIRDLHRVGAVKDPKHGVKLLSKGSDLLKTSPPMFIEVPHASDNCIKAIQEAGGQVRRVTQGAHQVHDPSEDHGAGPAGTVH